METLERDASGAPPVVSRRRLLRRLDAAVEGKLTIVKAPAGFGKSTLLHDWAASYRRAPVIPLALGRTPADRDRFGGIVVDALADVERWAGEVRKVDVGMPEAIVVLDSLEALRGERTLDELAELVHGAGHLRFVVSTRIDPEPLSERFRASGQLAELGQDDLAFRRAEARAVLERTSGGHVSDQAADDLFDRTEGWPAALRMAARTIRPRPGDGRGADVDADAEADGGSAGPGHDADEDVRRYLRSEVLSPEAASVQRFLLRTSVLDGLNAALCDAVLGQGLGSAELMLRYLDGNSLFTTHSGGGTYHYHPVFRDFLRHELRLAHGDLEPTLLCRAADWHVGRDEPAAAAAYLRDAEAWPRLLELVGANGRRLLEPGGAAALRSWLDWVPAAARHGRRLEVFKSAALDTVIGRTRLAEQTLRELGPPASLGAGEQLAVDCLTCCWVQMHARPAAVIEAADHLLDRVDEVPADAVPDVFGLTDPASLRTIAAGSRARARWYSGRSADARRELAALARSGAAAGPWLVDGLGGLALLDAWDGRLRAALARAQEALDLAGRIDLAWHRSTLDARLALARVHRERDDLEAAAAALDEVHAIARASLSDAPMAFHALELARLRSASGDTRRGLGELAAFRAEGWAPPPPLVEAAMRATEVGLLLDGGEVARAVEAWRAWVPERDAPDGPELGLVAVRLALATDDPAAARRHLERTSPVAGDNPRWATEHGLWSAIVDDAEGDQRAALARLGDLVDVAGNEGLVRLFLDGGPAVTRLLRLLCRTAPTEYILVVLEGAQQGGEALAAGPGPAGDALSARELAVLRFLPSNQSNTEIAARLYVSINTLKSHLRSIYRKLGVTGRREAVERASALGLA